MPMIGCSSHVLIAEHEEDRDQRTPLAVYILAYAVANVNECLDFVLL